MAQSSLLSYPENVFAFNASIGYDDVLPTFWALLNLGLMYSMSLMVARKRHKA